MKEKTISKILHRHTFSFDPKNNGGESLTLVTEFIDNGDNNDHSIFTNQKLTLNSYCNSASFNFNGIQITPEILRQLANELESAKIQAKQARREDYEG